MMSRSASLWHTRLGGALALTLAAACSRPPAEEAVQAAVSVRTMVVTAEPFTETIGAIGDVEPRAGHVAALSAPAPTRVAQVFATAGQHVRRGTLLVQLEETIFEAGARSAQAAVDAALRNYERAQRLVDVLPRKDLDQAASDLAQARANLVTAQRNRELSSLRAPIDGVVTRMNAVLGASVDVNQVLVEMADPSAVDVVLGMTPSDAGRLRIGASALLRSGQGTTGDTLGRATVVDVGGIVDSATRSVAVRVRPGTMRRTLRLGETVSGEVTVTTHRNAIVVPNDALVPEGEGFKVFVVDSANIAHEREVTIGGRTGSLVEILSGLKAGERVVTYGAYGVADSAKVVPDTVKPAAAKP
jgi:membrane fusion protein, multidrug efflux system